MPGFCPWHTDFANRGVRLFVQRTLWFVSNRRVAHSGVQIALI